MYVGKGKMYSCRSLQDGVGLIRIWRMEPGGAPSRNSAPARDILTASYLPTPQDNWADLGNYGPRASDPVRLPEEVKELWRQEAAFKQRAHC